MSGNNVLEQLFLAKDYFLKRQDLFDDMANAKAKYDNIESFRNGSTVMLFLLFVGFVIYCWKCFLPFGRWFLNDLESVVAFFNKLRTMMPQILVFILWLVLVPVIFLGFYLLIMVIVLIISSIIKSIITGPSIKRQIQIIDEKMDEIAAYYNQYENVMGETCPVPLERCHPFLIEQIIGMISSKRAESIKEAINLIIQDEHNQKIANLAEQQLLQLEQANYYLKAISKNTKKIANDTSAIKWNTFFNNF